MAASWWRQLAAPATSGEPKVGREGEVGQKGDGCLCMHVGHWKLTPRTTTRWTVGAFCLAFHLIYSNLPHRKRDTERERDNVINAEMKQYLRKYLLQKCKSHDLWPFHMLYIKSLGHNLKAIKQMIYATTF